MPAAMNTVECIAFSASILLGIFDIRIKVRTVVFLAYTNIEI